MYCLIACPFQHIHSFKDNERLNTVQSYPSFVLCEREGNLAKIARGSSYKKRKIFSSPSPPLPRLMQILRKMISLGSTQCI